MGELVGKAPSVFDSIRSRIRELEKEPQPSHQMSLGFTDLQPRRLVAEVTAPDPWPGKKPPAPILDEEVQIRLQSIGFPHVSVNPGRGITYMFTTQRRRHNRGISL